MHPQKKIVLIRKTGPAFFDHEDRPSVAEPDWISRVAAFLVWAAVCAVVLCAIFQAIHWMGKP